MTRVSTLLRLLYEEEEKTEKIIRDDEMVVVVYDTLPTFVVFAGMMMTIKQIIQATRKSETY